MLYHRSPQLDFPFPTRRGTKVERPYAIPQGFYISGKWKNLVCKQERACSAWLHANLPPLCSKKRQEQDGEELEDLTIVAGQALQATRCRPGNVPEGEMGGRVDKRAKTTKEEVEITGQPIKVADSLLDNQRLAMTLLNRIALPKDVDLLRRGKADNMAELCYYAVKVHEKMSLKGELKAEKAEVQKAVEEIQKLKKSVAEAAVGLAEKEKLGTEVKDLKE
ncbi:hypothetical protein RHSIM_Rhsim13G0131400 [Rhododendron simsii]|uniref:Uncharacterized protein n=1 Tax=Rhododendron simsii TaxID=118357 RepID=A0A834FYH2_RHOSS|nr:hypothetical protein RHSIM_Rhsim13G0131400 [Rhododendron simsii]